MPTADQLARLDGSNGGSVAGIRNAIINGNFDIWQRGTSFSSPGSGSYLADRWQLLFTGSGATRTISRQAFTLGQTQVPNEPEFFFRFDQSVAGSGGTFQNLYNKIEDVRSFAGQQVTVSFWLKAAAAAVMPSIVLEQQFGTGGSPSTSVSTTVASNVNVGTSWARYTYTVTLPSISGKTLGTNNNDHLALIIQFPINATFTIDLAQVQLEQGSFATPFERRPIELELSLCKRYYTTGDGVGLVLYAPISGATNTRRGFVQYPVEMRAVPTITATAANIGALTSTANIRGTILIGTPASDLECGVQTFTADAEL